MKKKRRKWIALAAATVLAVTALAGCAQNPRKMSGTVSTDGSTSMEKVITALGEAFENQNSGVTSP